MTDDGSRHAQVLVLAAHRYWRAEWSAQDTRACSATSTGCHGHNYVLR